MHSFTHSELNSSQIYMYIQCIPITYHKGCPYLASLCATLYPLPRLPLITADTTAYETSLQHPENPSLPRREISSTTAAPRSPFAVDRCSPCAYKSETGASPSSLVPERSRRPPLVPRCYLDAPRLSPVAPVPSTAPSLTVPVTAPRRLQPPSQPRRLQFVAPLCATVCRTSASLLRRFRRPPGCRDIDYAARTGRLIGGNNGAHGA